MAEKNNTNPVGSLEYFKAVPYKDLKKEFDTLGIKDVWKAGGKKPAMVAKAAEQYKALQALKDSGLDDEAVQAALEQREKDQEVADAKKAEELEQAEAAKQAALQKKVEKKELTVDQIKANIANIDANLLGATEFQRKILLNKRKSLELILKKKES